MCLPLCCRPERRLYGSEETLRGMASNFFLQEIDSEKEYEKNISGIVYRIRGTDDDDGVYINYVGQPITQSLEVDSKQYMLILRRERTHKHKKETTRKKMNNEEEKDIIHNNEEN